MYIISVNICYNSISKRMDNRNFYKCIDNKTEAYWMYHWFIKIAHDYKMIDDCFVSVILEECEEMPRDTSGKYATRIIESWHNDNLFY